MTVDYKKKVTMDPSAFVLLADYVPAVVQEIRYYSTYNFIGERIDGYEEPCAILTRQAARALKAVSNEMNVRGYRLKIFDAYRPACAVKHFVLWGIEDTDIRMKPYFYPDLEKWIWAVPLTCSARSLTRITRESQRSSMKTACSFETP